MTNATYTNPRQVATYVRSATQSSLGWVAVNCRATRSAGLVVAVSGIVVTSNARPRTAPARPSRRINAARAGRRRRLRRATVQRATATPSRLSWFQTLRTP